MLCLLHGSDNKEKRMITRQRKVMKAVSTVGITTACIIGASAVLAADEIREGAVVKPATRPAATLQVAQAKSTAGGAAAGASTASAAAGALPGSTTVVIVGAAVAAVAMVAKSSETTTNH